MTNKEVQTFFFHACSFLNISYQEKEKNCYEILIPESLTPSFHQPSFLVSFSEKDEEGIINLQKDSYLVKKVAELVSSQTKGIATGTLSLKNTSFFTQPGDYFIGWFKTTVYGHSIEQYIRPYVLECANGTIKTLSDAFKQELSSIQEEKIKVPKKERLLNYVSSLQTFAFQHAIPFIKMKQFEYNRLIDEEIERINNYYGMLRDENSLAETYSEQDTISLSESRKLLEKEKEHLIQQQIEKYSLREDHIQVEPLTFLFLRCQ